LSQAMCPGNQGSVLGMVIGTRSEGWAAVLART
jgi:hypothetical protein